jgi:hypothetical protein
MAAAAAGLCLENPSDRLISRQAGDLGESAFSARRRYPYVSRSVPRLAVVPLMREIRLRTDRPRENAYRCARVPPHTNTGSR